MTLGMWFAWLLRADVRAGAAVDDADGQHRMVAWWLANGQREYPACWWYGPAQVAVAMMPGRVVGDVHIPLLLHHVWLGRADLQAAFALRHRRDAIGLLCWYRINGAAELDAAPLLPRHLLALTETVVPGDGCNETPVQQALRQAGLRVCPAATPLPAGLAPQPGCHTPVQGRSQRGLTLIGPASSSGIGQDVLMTSLALRTAGIAHCVMDDAGDVQPAGDTTLYCSTAFDTARLFLERGPGFFAASRRIGSWAWELPDFPSVWADVFCLVTEIWAHSTYTLRAFQASSPVPVRYAPSCVCLAEHAHLAAFHPDAAGGYSTDRPFLFYYAFDPRSYTARKNPLALVQAFQVAFAQEDQGVCLYIRASAMISVMMPDLQAAAAQDSRIIIECRPLLRHDALQQMAVADCFVSPHRAEGFGRNIAEAILLHVPVLATDFSGCTDFLQDDEAVRWRSLPVQQQDYVFGDGQRWADPDIADLSQRMRQSRRQCLRRKPDGRIKLQKRAEAFSARWGVQATGRRYAALLAENMLPHANQIYMADLQESA